MILRHFMTVAMLCVAIGCQRHNNTEQASKPAKPVQPAEQAMPQEEPSKETPHVAGLEEGWELAPEATYAATQTGGQVIIVAVGEHPASNFEAKLVQSMLRIWPPQYMLARRQTGDVGATVMTPFEATASFDATDPVQQVTIHDAAGRHEVKVERE